MMKMPSIFALPRASEFLRLVMLVLLSAAGFALSAADEQFETFQPAANRLAEKFEGYSVKGSNHIARFESLTIGSNTFEHVTVLSTNRRDIFFRHAGGLANVKVTEVEPEILKQLGYKVAETERASSNPLGAMSAQVMTNLTQKLEDDPRFQQLESQWMAQVAPRMPPISKGLIAGVIGVVVAIYLFFSFCCMQIVRKTGNQPGLLVWLPILKMLPLLRAAGMPGWWFLIWLLPVVNLIPAIMWPFKIVETRGKSVIWAIMLLLPGTNLLAFLYLAFSDGAAPEAKPTAHSRPLARAA